MAIQQKEMELRSQEDALYQMKKEHSLREFDIANTGPGLQQQQQKQVHACMLLLACSHCCYLCKFKEHRY